MAFLTTHPDNAFEPWEISLAERLVRAFLISRAPGKLEFDDLLQECLLHWWQQRDRYSASRGASPQTFFRRVFRQNSWTSRGAHKRRSAVAPAKNTICQSRWDRTTRTY